MKKDYLEIPLDKLRDIIYTNPNRERDQLEWSFIETISRETGFFMKTTIFRDIMVLEVII